MTMTMPVEVESDSMGWKDLGIKADDTIVPEEVLGTLDEAMFIWSVIGESGYGRIVESKAPEGWSFLGSGKSRSAWLSPSGIVYKLCHRYYGQSLSSNDIEHKNFAYIRKGGKLREGWKVPHSFMHIIGTKKNRIAVLACEYAKGDTWESSYETEMEAAMRGVGLSDCYSGNAILSSDGTKWIIDAAEGLLELSDSNE